MDIVHDDGTQNKFVFHLGWRFADSFAAWLDWQRRQPEHDEAAMPVTASEELAAEVAAIDLDDVSINQD